MELPNPYSSTIPPENQRDAALEKNQPILPFWSRTVRWTRVLLGFFTAFSYFALLVGILHVCVTTYDCFLRNWFAQGTSRSEYVYYPIKLRLYVECISSLQFGIFFYLASRSFGRSKPRIGLLFVLCGVVWVGLSRGLASYLRSIGW